MIKCGKGCMPECQYFTTGGCMSPFNCPYKIEAGYINSATSTPDIMSMTNEKMIENLKCVIADISAQCNQLKAENAELKSSLTHANEEWLKWHERAQNLLKDSGGSISGYEKKISALQSENAELRARLEKAVEVPFVVLDKTTGKEADLGEIALHEEWAKSLVYCDMDGFAITQDGALLLLDECGKFEYCPSDRFEIVAEARLKEIKEKKDD